MILEDHICLIPNPLIGKNLDDLGPRFPDMSEPYDKNLIKLTILPHEKNIHLKKEHTWALWTSFETPGI